MAEGGTCVNVGYPELAAGEFAFSDADTVWKVGDG